MTSLILEVYDAFKSVGVDDEKARAAAGALSGHEQQIGDLKSHLDHRFDALHTDMVRRFDTLQSEVDRRFEAMQTEMDRRFDAMQAYMDRRFDAMQSQMDSRFNQADLKYEKRFGKIEADILLLKWMTGVMFAGVASLVFRAFF